MIRSQPCVADVAAVGLSLRAKRGNLSYEPEAAGKRENGTETARCCCRRGEKPGLCHLRRSAPPSRFHVFTFSFLSGSPLTAHCSSLLSRRKQCHIQN